MKGSILAILFAILYAQVASAQCGASLNINTATTVLPGTTITATASGGNVPGSGYYSRDYQWLAMGGSPIRTGTSSGTNSNSFTTTFNDPGVYDICVTAVCGSGSSHISDYETICIEITVTEPDGSPPNSTSWCGGTNDVPADLIGNAPTVCNFDDYCNTTIDYCGPNNSGCGNDDGINPPSGGSGQWTLENNSYVAFIAEDDFACFDLDITCIPHNAGIQADILSWNGSGGTGGFSSMLSNGGGGTDGVDYQDWNNNYTRRDGTNRRMCAENLTVGQTYYILVDGHNGDFCNYSMRAVSGVEIPETIDNFVNGVQSLTICETDLPYALNLTTVGGNPANYTWTQNGLNIGSTQNISVNLNSGSGSFEFIVESISAGTGACDPPIGSPMTSSVNVEVTATSIVTPTISGSNIICEGETATLTANPSGPDILWSTGSTSSTITAGEGTYTVSVNPSTTNNCQQGTSADFIIGSPLACLTICQETNGDISAINGTPTYDWVQGSAVLVYTNGQQTITPNGTFPIVVTDGASDTYTILDAAGLAGLAACPTVVLPVEISLFKANCNDSRYELEWTTESEFNASHFEIEKSTNIQNFEYIGRVDASGNTNNKQYYSFTDLTSYSNFNEQNYYRIKQVDFDGNYKRYGPITANCNIEDFTLFPNPSNGIFNMTLPKGDSYSIQVFSLDGKMVYTDLTNHSTHSLDLEYLSNGTYILQVIGNNSEWKKTLVKY